VPVQVKIMGRRRGIFVIGWKEAIHPYPFNLMSGSVVYFLCSLTSPEKNESTSVLLNSFAASLTVCCL